MDKGSLIATLFFLISFSKTSQFFYKEQNSQEREVPPVLVYKHPDSVFPCLGFTAAISQHGLCIKQAKDNRNTPNQSRSIRKKLINKQLPLSSFCFMCLCTVFRRVQHCQADSFWRYRLLEMSKELRSIRNHHGKRFQLLLQWEFKIFLIEISHSYILVKKQKKFLISLN